MSGRSPTGASSVTSTVHDDFLRMFKEEGLEELATEVGIMRNGEIPALKNYVAGQLSREPAGEEKYPDMTNVQESEGNAQDTHDNTDDPRTFDERQLAQQIEMIKSMNRGLRQSSMKVLRKVEEKGKTTYNEVADELVAEYTMQRKGLGVVEEDEGKNIKRRVYDILNVLIAMEIITKEKKDIHWRGLPSNAEKDLQVLERKRKASLKSIAEKKQHLQDLLMQQLALQNLIKRNQRSKQPIPAGQRIPLPFIVVNSNKKTVIECEMADDRTDVFFNFSQPFEIHDDNEVLKRMKLQHAPTDGSKLSDLIPESLIRFLPQEIREKTNQPEKVEKTS